MHACPASPDKTGDRCRPSIHPANLPRPENFRRPENQPLSQLEKIRFLRIRRKGGMTAATPLYTIVKYHISRDFCRLIQSTE
jgi:hypothetical protein